MAPIGILVPGRPNSPSDGRAQHYLRPGPPETQASRSFQNGSTLTFGPNDPVEDISPGEPFYEQALVIESATADLLALRERYRGTGLDPDLDADEVLSPDSEIGSAAGSFISNLRGRSSSFASQTTFTPRCDVSESTTSKGKGKAAHYQAPFTGLTRSVANVYQSKNRSDIPGERHPGYSTDTRFGVLSKPLDPQSGVPIKGTGMGIQRGFGYNRRGGVRLIRRQIELKLKFLNKDSEPPLQQCGSNVGVYPTFMKGHGMHIRSTITSVSNGYVGHAGHADHAGYAGHASLGLDNAVSEGVRGGPWNGKSRHRAYTPDDIYGSGAFSQNSRSQPEIGGHSLAPKPGQSRHCVMAGGNGLPQLAMHNLSLNGSKYNGHREDSPKVSTPLPADDVFGPPLHTPREIPTVSREPEKQKQKGKQKQMEHGYFRQLGKFDQEVIANNSMKENRRGKGKQFRGKAVNIALAHAGGYGYQKKRSYAQTPHDHRCYINSMGQIISEPVITSEQAIASDQANPYPTFVLPSPPGDGPAEFWELQKSITRYISRDQYYAELTLMDIQDRDAEYRRVCDLFTSLVIVEQPRERPFGEPLAYRIQPEIPSRLPGVIDLIGPLHLHDELIARNVNVLFNATARYPNGFRTPEMSQMMDDLRYAMETVMDGTGTLGQVRVLPNERRPEAIYQRSLQHERAVQAAIDNIPPFDPLEGYVESPSLSTNVEDGTDNDNILSRTESSQGLQRHQMAARERFQSRSEPLDDIAGSPPFTPSRPSSTGTRGHASKGSRDLSGAM